MKKKIIRFCLLPIACCLLICACKKDSFINSADARLSTSADSLKYDTVFTTVGSVTQSFKISNLNNQKLRLSDVKLMGGPGSPYKIIINGITGPEVTGIEVNANDSIYVFVTVTIDPNDVTLPFIIKDSILISYNGNSRFVQLEAFGQNAHFLRDMVITSDTTWTNDLPFVILGSLKVDTNVSLTIQQGSRLFAHADAPFIIDGTLITNGTRQDSVVFAGDRLDPDYKDLPASWPGIYFRGNSKNNELTHTIIKNAYQAIAAEKPSVNSSPKVLLHQCTIDNAYDAGIICLNSSLQADNTLVSNCGNNIIFSDGGDYKLTHCTVAGYYNSFISHKNPVLLVNNFAEIDGAVVPKDLKAVFLNCIFWGDTGNAQDDEIAVVKKGDSNFNVFFDHCLYKAKNDPANTTFDSGIKNQDPLFDSIDVNKNYFDFHTRVNAAAPGIDKGSVTGFLKDLDDNNRNIGLPDLGCYEKQ